MAKFFCSRYNLLVTEFDSIFHDLFNGKGATYKNILNSLKDGAKTLAEIRESIAFPPSGTLSHMMEHLIVAGFVVKQALWSFKTAKVLKQSLYAISDPYIRFYLKLIEPNLDKIAKLKIPRGFAGVPVLLHLSGVTDAVATSPYFYRIDIVDFLESS